MEIKWDIRLRIASKRINTQEQIEEDKTFVCWNGKIKDKSCVYGLEDIIVEMSIYIYSKQSRDLMQSQSKS
jgi:hypothetical protein